MLYKNVSKEVLSTTLKIINLKHINTNSQTHWNPEYDMTVSKSISDDVKFFNELTLSVANNYRAAGWEQYAVGLGMGGDFVYR